MLYCITGDLVHFCFCDVFRVHTAYCGAFIVHLEHDLHCLFRAHRKKCLQHLNDEFHRSVIIVQ